MILLPRAAARAFRALARKCYPGRPRGPAPPVTLRRHDGTLTLHVDVGEVVLTWTGPAAGESETVVVPLALLDAVDGPGDDPVQVDRDGSDRVVARWADRGVPRSYAVESVPADEARVQSEVPKTWQVVATAFLGALHEAGRTAAREPSRYALQRIQLRGAKGRVIGTDGKRAYLRGGFSLPFAEDLLVPAVPTFGAKDLGPKDVVRVGLTDNHVMVAVGPWTVGLQIDREGRFPDVAAVLPKRSPTVIGVDDRDADALIDLLPGLPGTDGDHDPVTLVADGGAFVRAGAEKETVEVHLSRSTFAGPAAAVAMGRGDLRRMLALGGRTLRLCDGSKPVVGEAEDLVFAAMPLDESCVTPESPAAARIDTDAAGRVGTRAGRVAPTPPASSASPATIPMPSLEERTAMKPTVPAHPSEPNGEVLDPLAEAEGLRAALADVVTRAARLVAALRHLRKEKRALATVWSSLKDLHLGA